MLYRRIPKIIQDYDQHVAEISEIANAGYVLTFNYCFGKGVQYLDYTYPEEWYETYVKNHYAGLDPTVIINSASPATRKWSSPLMRQTDVLGIFKKAKRYNLNFGATSCVRSKMGASFLSVARHDRDLTDSEVDYVDMKLKFLCQLVNAEIMLTDRERNVLALLSGGKKQGEIADFLGISLATVKNVIQDLKVKLYAENTIEMVGEALRRKLI